MVGSHQWRISFPFVLTRCRRFQFLVTNIGPNDLKIILQIKKTFLFENIWSMLLDVCLFVHTGALKLAKLPQGWQSGSL